MPRFVALDVGTRTIGVASAEAPVGVPTPQFTLKRKSVKADAEALHQRFDDVTAWVVGLPVHDDGSEGSSARRARQVGDALAGKGHVVHYQDESFSSHEAETRLLEAGVDARRRKQMIDQVAAVVILEDWLAERGGA